MATASNVLGSIVIIFLIAGAGYYLFVMDDGAHDPLKKEVELNITVRSVHMMYNVDFVLYVNENEYGSGTLGPHDEEIFNVTVSVRAGSTVDITAESEGGGLGPQSSSKSIRIWSSSSHNVLLLV